MSSVKYDDDKLAAYHTAYFNSGAKLYVPDNVEISEPIEGIFLPDMMSDVPLSSTFWLSQAKTASLAI